MRQKIIQAASRLLEKEGVEAVTMRGVAQLVGVTPMALYRHYADRAVLLNALADDGFIRLTALLKNKRITGNL
ncbi:MAG TPA: helix-turn-helix domain-containing protein, partial [Steroidobacteraceae bacterium]|nr:helix-turn-helix domain-containing protein [Steroidobacteraceae bacterium]